MGSEFEDLFEAAESFSFVVLQRASEVFTGVGFRLHSPHGFLLKYRWSQKTFDFRAVIKIPIFKMIARLYGCCSHSGLLAIDYKRNFVGANTTPTPEY